MKKVLTLLAVLVGLSHAENHFIKIGTETVATVCEPDDYSSFVQSITEGKVVQYDPFSGIALVEGIEGKAVQLGDSRSLNAGDKLYTSDAKEKVAACFLGREGRKDGRVLPLGYLRLNYSEDYNESGGYLYNESGELVAVSYKRDPMVKNLGYAVPAEAMKRVASDYEKNGKLSRCWVGLVIDSSNSIPEVTSIRPDSPAKKAGLQRGDILIRVGGRSIKTYLNAVDAFYYLVANQEEEFEVIRGTEVITVKMLPVATSSFLGN